MAQVSYLIVDEADNDMDMGTDPFLEAGISVPDELPYLRHHPTHHDLLPSSDEKITRKDSMRSISSMKPINKKHSVSLMSVNRIRDAMGVPASPSPRPVRHRGESESQYSPKLPTALSRWDPLVGKVCSDMCIAWFGSFESLDAVTCRKTSHSIGDSLAGGRPQRREGVFRSTRRLAGRSLGLGCCRAKLLSLLLRCGPD